MARDLEKNPYSKDEKRIIKFFQERIGHSEDLMREDPITSLLAIWEGQAQIIRRERAEKEAALREVILWKAQAEALASKLKDVVEDCIKAKQEHMELRK